MNLHQQFVQLGQSHKEILRKIAAILPRIYEQKIYESYAENIYEYARKYAGLSSGVVQKILRTYKNIENKPEILKAIETAGIHKVALVSKIATAENQTFIADKVNHLSKSALEQFVKDYRREKQVALFGEMDEIIKVELDIEMQFLLNKLKKKFGENLSNKEALRRVLQKMCEIKFSESYENSIPQQTAKISKSFPGETLRRYIPVTVRKLAIQNTNGKCAVKSCTKTYDHLHHQIPFSLSHNHDSIIPLCRNHHEIAHNGVRFIDGKMKTTNLSEVDELYRKYRSSRD